MWAVGLGASTALLLDFYRRWLIEGVAPELALARAQRCLAEQPEGAYRHLAHWAAFQYVGV
jgi:CHAT domain-containing protein